MSRLTLVLERQWLHLTLLFILLAVLSPASGLEGMRSGELLGISTFDWFRFAVILAIAHQMYVWFCWRLQLHGSWLTRIFGHLGFPLFAMMFSILGLCRLIAVIIVAISNQGSLPWDPSILRMLAVILALPAVYLLYSVKRYFGFKRAFGLDHFDEGYRSRPFVREGIFRFTRNGMYTFGPLMLWAFALWFASKAALCLALFNHLYVWVHYFSTELPDMQRIYGKNRLRKSGPCRSPTRKEK